MLVGIVSGTYSTVFIASAIAIILSKRKAAVRASGAPAGDKDKKDRKARAS
jgi:preprotein translocase subunit SecF